jgi:hypothetical protein
MGDPYWKYWHQVIPDSSESGLRDSERCEILSARNLISELIENRQIPEIEDIKQDTKVLSILLEMMQAGGENSPAGHCLRCYTSHQIKYICRNLAYKYSRKFSERDIFPYALDDRIGMTDRSLAIQILAKFDPSKAKLNTYIQKNHLLTNYPPVRNFLMEHGIGSQTDWGILNDKKITSGSLERFLRKLNSSSMQATEIEATIALYGCFREVYTRDRERNREGCGDICHPPTPEQLQEMCNLLGQSSPQRVLSELLILAGHIRYDKRTKGEPKPENIVRGKAAEIEIENTGYLDRDLESLEIYEQIKVNALKAIEITIDRYNQNERKREYLKAFQLYLCQGFSQVNTAIAMEWSDGDNAKVSYQLKAFRLNVSKRLFNSLKEGTFAREFKEAAENDQSFTEIKGIIDLYLKENIVPGSQTVLSCAVCRHLELIGIK